MGYFLVVLVLDTILPKRLPHHTKFIKAAPYLANVFGTLRKLDAYLVSRRQTHISFRNHFVKHMEAPAQLVRSPACDHLFLELILFGLGRTHVF